MTPIQNTQVQFSTLLSGFMYFIHSSHFRDTKKCTLPTYNPESIPSPTSSLEWFARNSTHLLWNCNSKRWTDIKLMTWKLWLMQIMAERESCNELSWKIQVFSVPFSVIPEVLKSVWSFLGVYMFFFYGTQTREAMKIFHGTCALLSCWKRWRWCSVRWRCTRAFLWHSFEVSAGMEAGR